MLAGHLKPMQRMREQTCFDLIDLVTLRQGSEKLKELEELMAGSGLFNENFSLGLGDVMEVSDNEDNDGSGGPGPAPKPKANAFPPVDGKETAAEFVAKYKRAALNRRQVFRENQVKWNEEKPNTGAPFDCAWC